MVGMTVTLYYGATLATVLATNTKGTKLFVLKACGAKSWVRADAAKAVK